MSTGEPKPSLAETIEDAPLTGGGPYAARPTFKQKVINHFKRFWWLHLIVFLAVGLLLTLLLIFVGFPRIAQNGVSDSKLNITSQAVSNPTPKSVDIDLVSIVSSSSSFHPTLDSFDAALFLPAAGSDHPFGHLTIPSLKAAKNSTVTVNQTMQIVDMEQFINYNEQVLSNETYQVTLKGRTALHEGRFPVTHVNFEKTTTLKGLNGLKGFKVQTFNISLEPLSDGSNIQGSVFIPNPSVLTITMGNVTLNLAVDKTPIGTSTIQNVVLKPGDNVLPMRGISDQAAVLNLITSKYKDGILPVNITGNSSVYNGQHLPYYEAALQSNVMNTQLDVGKALAQIGINISSLTGGTGGSSDSQPSSAAASSSAGSSSSSPPSSSAAPASGSSASSSSALLPADTSGAALPGFATSTNSGLRVRETPAAIVL
ncbi:hypothetical protein NA57DRAFT_55343 [Rhizodiscina lignyota]|uniref:Uncharacterized protein n=1 Tax=Rhizodiscina lignyota TaxID=1504668 RepID=A0A9P4M9H6_9PEZI|nr:hypothetical protein NA57DRAFT_55343 [Rhizodiscina lignyota]